MARPERLSAGASLSERLTETLRAAIASGGYRVGAALPTEQELAASFGVSRSVVREAVSRLKADQLVISRQGLGAFVVAKTGSQGFRIPESRGRTHDGIRHVLELRMGMEVEAAGLAANGRTRQQLAEMRGCLAEMRAATDALDLDRLIAADLQFHRTVCVASRNPLFVSLFNFLEPHLSHAIAQTRVRSSRHGRKRLEDAQDEHKRIFAAIERGDTPAARAAARRHIANTIRRLATDDRQPGARSRPA